MTIATTDLPLLERPARSLLDWDRFDHRHRFDRLLAAIEHTHHVPATIVRRACNDRDDLAGGGATFGAALRSVGLDPAEVLACVRAVEGAEFEKRLSLHERAVADLHAEQESWSAYLAGDFE